uniref:PPM-type phosphatase domain-containing protein n=1 Tax=Craspedostauros australis TaxID=1486917 RepID=A0A7R9ZIN9_9STRA|mmetsp:Transcript_12899/g.35629  ORF Transcript_12899/g.35629 Transcript_12899/m.35629 type:complete len:142 (+) Transcript_12899:571-996(+)
MGGFVSPPPEPGLSARVWLDSTCTQIGLAMARSIGDHAVKPIGVIAEPVVTQHKIHPDDEFMILATDGVWEFISSEEAVKVVSDNMHLGATKACQCLIEAAAARWHDEEGDYRDDITALVIRLQRLWDAETGKTKRKRETT